uniref:CAAX prenyl protease 2/Lysostaphin resistance protein A-like domain-containing protein n=1 Tax=Physcomitrium patens TaxID=3218 RepID=A9TU87_PHYPA
MEMGARFVCLATPPRCGLCFGALSPGAATTGKKIASSYRSSKVRPFLGTSLWKLLPQDSFVSRRPPLINAAKQSGNQGKNSKTPPSADKLDDEKLTESSRLEGQAVEEKVNKKNSDIKTAPAAREEVLKACVNTSAALAIAGIAIRQGTHWAAEANWSVPDCYLGMTYNFQAWHLGVTLGTVTLIASLRQILLSTWPEFSQSSRQSNKQVLSSLELNDYLLVSFLPGISEELLFRGAILPLIGVDWRGVVFSGLVFGILHISGGRNAAFAAWASFVGCVYGLAAIITNDLAVPMVAHSVANLVAAYVWRIESNNDTKI